MEKEFRNEVKKTLNLLCHFILEFPSRARSLSRYNDEFPCNLAMLEKNDHIESLMGHVRLSRVLDNDDSLLVTSLIISEKSRGKGLGRKILHLTEDFAKYKGIKCLYLKSKIVEFYQKCGYIESSPVEEYTSKMMKEKMSQLMEQFSSKTPTEEDAEDYLTLDSHDDNYHTEDISLTETPLLPPPLPPPPLATPPLILEEEDGGIDVWMKKVLN